jgi:hypothetical protein
VPLLTFGENPQIREDAHRGTQRPRAGDLFKVYDNVVCQHFFHTVLKFELRQDGVEPVARVAPEFHQRKQVLLLVHSVERQIAGQIGKQGFHYLRHRSNLLIVRQLEKPLAKQELAVVLQPNDLERAKKPIGSEQGICEHLLTIAIIAGVYSTRPV